MEYQVVQSKISMNECDFIITGWQIRHQPIGQLVHGGNVSVGGSVVLLCPS